MRTPRAGLIIVVLALAGAHPSRAQEPTPVPATVGDSIMEVRLADGAVLYGRFERVEGDRVTLITVGGARLTVDRSQIRTVRRARGAARANGSFWPRDPNGTRLFWGPTARSLGAGEASFGVFELIMPFVAYGVSDRLSVAGGLPIIPDELGRYGYLAPKLQLVSSEGAQVAVGGVVVFGIEDVDATGLLYGVATIGSTDDAVTVGAALPFFRDGAGEGEIARSAVILMGGETRVSRRLKLLTENYWDAGEGDVLTIGGVRILGDRLTADVGVAAFFADPVECCAPVVSFGYTFGGR